MLKILLAFKWLRGIEAVTLVFRQSVVRSASARTLTRREGIEREAIKRTAAVWREARTQRLQHRRAERVRQEYASAQRIVCRQRCERRRRERRLARWQHVLVWTFNARRQRRRRLPGQLRAHSPLGPVLHLLVLVGRACALLTLSALRRKPHRESESRAPAHARHRMQVRRARAERYEQPWLRQNLAILCSVVEGEHAALKVTVGAVLRQVE
mmetsp:Transcript_6215/g.13547  ORF Transcript_6215/g.13547 Transcript_6215/m.13547 type:complete len:212 (-) Transcript_6215:953-1588(-)